MVTKLQENTSHHLQKKYIAQHHGFDRDFWDGSPDSPMTVIYRVHVKPRSAMFDRRHFATFPIPDGTRIVSRKTFLEDLRERRTAEVEHVFVRDTCAWSASIEGVTLAGVSMFRLASPVEPRVMRTAEGRETGTGYTKLDAPLQWPQEVAACLQSNQSSWHWDMSKYQQHWGWEATESNQESRSCHSDRPGSKGDLDHTESAKGHRGSSTKGDEDDHRANQQQLCDPFCCQKGRQSS